MHLTCANMLMMWRGDLLPDTGSVARQALKRATFPPAASGTTIAPTAPASAADAAAAVVGVVDLTLTLTLARVSCCCCCCC